MPSFYPKNNAEFTQWLGNFITVAEANKAVLGMSIDDIAILESLKTGMDDDMTAHVTAQEQARAATTKLDDTRSAANKEIGHRGRSIALNPKIPNSLKEQLGLNVPDKKRGNVPLYAPSGLIVEGSSNGTNRLRWERNGNIPGTQFILEAKIGDNKEFVFVGVATRTTFEHTNQKPGTPTVYRVRASRSSQLSGFSNEAIIYFS